MLQFYYDMLLNTKLAFEIWVGIVVLIIAIGGIAGITLLFSDETIPLLTRTQLNNADSPAPTPFVSEVEILNVSQDISQTLLGGTAP